MEYEERLKDENCYQNKGSTSANCHISKPMFMILSTQFNVRINRYWKNMFPLTKYLLRYYLVLSFSNFEKIPSEMIRKVAR